ncbi:MAG: acylphosphatase, partial [Planctomycetia bacterium]|nr:acylphosphatase [Planctomycetia bacterium]
PPLLFHLGHDPAEKFDVAKDHADVLADIAKEVATHKAGMKPGENQLDKSLPMKPTGKMVQYSGKVQGVGFRASVDDLARQFPVTGWVKNLADGRVQLLAEGPEYAVALLLQGVRDRWKDNIAKAEVADQAVTGKFKAFVVVE